MEGCRKEVIMDLRIKGKKVRFDDLVQFFVDHLMDACSLGEKTPLLEWASILEVGNPASRGRKTATFSWNFNTIERSKNRGTLTVSLIRDRGNNQGLFLQKSLWVECPQCPDFLRANYEVSHPGHSHRSEHSDLELEICMY